MNVTDILKQLDTELAQHVKTGNMQNSLAFFYEKIAPLNADFPDSPDILYYTGTAMMSLKMPGVAIPLLQRCLQIAPQHWQCMNNLGCCYKQVGKNERAKEIFYDAMKYGGSQNADLMNNLGGAFTSQGEPERGIAYARRAHELAGKDDRNLHQYTWNLALAYLELEEWKQGFKLYESGVLSGDRGIKTFADRHGRPLPLWDHQPGRRIIVTAEQGLGDNILFASALRYAHQDTCFTFDCHPRLYTLVHQSMPEIEAYPTYKEAPPYDWMKHREYDGYCGIGTLFGLYYERVLSTPKPYLCADPARIAYWRNRLKKTGDGPYIGFAWQGGTPYSNIWTRIFKASDFAPCFSQGAQWFSLQYTPKSLETVKRLGLSNVHHFSDAVQVHDYAETAAFISALDFVISPPQAIVHLCGAVGVPCLVMVPFERAWRYPLGDRMLWYKTVQQIHKPNGVPWGNFIATKIAHRVNSFLNITSAIT